MCVCFQRRCDLNCLSLKLSLIVLTVFLYGNGRGVARFMLSYSYSRKQSSERPCSHLQLSPHTHTHKHTHIHTHRIVIKTHRHVVYSFCCYRFICIQECVWACIALKYALAHIIIIFCNKKKNVCRYKFIAELKHRLQFWHPMEV